MADDRARRRLAAILAADVVGYGGLMEQDETGTLVALRQRRKAWARSHDQSPFGGSR
jgi:class 3 adenylate cyclase